MTPSIRTFLLINLLLSITLITSLAIIGNLFLEHKDLQKHLNAQLTVGALTIQAFVSDDIKNRDLSIIQNEINNLPDIAEEYYENDKKIFSPTYELIQFQIWDENGRMILHSSFVKCFVADGGKEKW